MKTSEKIDMVAASLFAVHRDLELPKKDTKGQAKGNKEYRYLSLPGLIDHAKQALKDAQVVVIQSVTGGSGFVEVTTTFMHFSGQWIEVGPIMLPASGDAQAYGSAITYARRYALAASLNLAADADDDGKRTSSDTATTGGTPRAPSTPSVQAPPAASGASEAGPSALGEADARPTQSTPEQVNLDGPGVEGEPLSGSGSPVESVSGGGGGSPTNYLTKDDQGLLKAEYGGQVAALEAYRKRFGSRITRLADITYEMRDEMGAA